MGFIENKIKELRKSKGMSQQQMAKLLGYKTKSGYCQLENGIVKMTVEKAEIIAEALGVKPEEIFFKNVVQV